MAEDLQQYFNKKLKFIIVTGPYTKLNYNEDYLKENNVEILRYTSELSTLLSLSDLNIIRPGYNTTLESLSGQGNTILMPSVSFMEDQYLWCQELQEKYGADYCNFENKEELKKLIIKNLTSNTKKAEIKNFALDVATYIHNFGNKYWLNDGITIACANEHSNDDIMSLQEIKEKSYIINEIKKITINSNVVSFIGNEIDGLNQKKYEDFYPELLYNKVILDFYLLRSKNATNLINEILNLVRKGYRNFYYANELSEIEQEQIKKQLQSNGIALENLDSLLDKKFNKLWNEYSWTPWEPYYKDLT